MTEPVRILFTIPNFITAGSGGAMLNIIERLDRSRLAPAICVSRKGGKLDAAVERMGIPFLEADFTIRAKPYATLPMRAARAARPFRALRPVLWHSFHYSDDYTEPLIARLSGARAWIYTKKNMNWRRRSWVLRSFLARRIAAQNTDMMRDFFSTPLFRYKVRLVPRGVVTERFRPEPPTGAIRAQLGVPAPALLVGSVGHLLPVKGHSTLIEAIARVPEVHLLLAGAPLEREHADSLERLVDTLGIAGRVHFLGGVSGVAELLAELDLFVLPTLGRGEGCPVALLEAMACGRACVATDIPGARDVVEHGKSGILVPPEDPEALAEAIRKLAASRALREELGRQARLRVLERYTIEREVDAHERLYEEILAPARIGS